MFKKSRFVLICVIFSLICVISGYAQEQITITTYYPSPYGSYNDLYVANRLGIGTTAPTEKLEITGAADAPSITAASGILRISSGPTPITGFTIGIQLASPYGTYLQSTNQPATSGAYPLLLNPLGGNVGIGTTGPVAELHVKGNVETVAIQADAPTAEVSYAWLASDATAANQYKWALTSQGGDGNNLRLYKSGGSHVMTWNQSNGNVGIGTTGPGSPLHVKGGSDNALTLEGPTSNDKWMIGVWDSNYLYFRNVVGADTKFRFEPGGAAYAESGPWTTGAVDLAEYFEQLNAGELQPYELVALAGDNKVRECKEDEAPIGVISTNPAFVGGENFDKTKKGNPRYALVGLIGQVKLRLTHDAKTGDIVAPDKYAKIIALEDGKAGEIIRVLLK